MSEISSLRKGEFLLWEIETPCNDPFVRKSPCFTFQGSQWCFNFFLEEDSDCVVSLVRTSEWRRSRPFDIYCYAESEGRETEVSVKGFTHLNVDPKIPPWIIWRAYPLSTSERIIDFLVPGKVSFVFTFRCDEECGRLKLMAETGDKSTQENFCSEFENLSLDFNNLLDRGELPDVHLECGDCLIPAHRSILAARCEFFAAMFRKRLVKYVSGVVKVSDMESPVLKLFLKFLYSGKIPGLSSDTAPKLYIVGDKYAVYSLKKMCIEFMIRNLSGENYQTFLKLAHTHNEGDFKSEVISFIADNPEFLFRDTWYTFLDEHPKLASEVYRESFEKQFQSKSIGR